MPAETTPAHGPAVLPEAVNLTLCAIEGRARLYRNLLVAVSSVSLMSILAALFFWRGLPVAGLILVVPLAGGFLFIDSRRVRLWREAILEMCGTRGLDLDLFLQTISQFKHVPAGSLQTMLTTLPTGGRGSENRIEEAPSAGKTGNASWRSSEWRILASTLILTLVLTGVTAAVFWKSPWALLAAGVLAIASCLLRRM